MKNTIILDSQNKKINLQGEIPVNIISQDDGTFVSDCPELGISSYGQTIDEAIRSFQEVLFLFLQDIIERGVAREILGQCGWKIVEDEYNINIIPPFVIKTIKTSISNLNDNGDIYA